MAKSNILSFILKRSIAHWQLVYQLSGLQRNQWHVICLYFKSHSDQEFCPVFKYSYDSQRLFVDLGITTFYLGHWSARIGHCSHLAGWLLLHLHYVQNCWHQMRPSSPFLHRTVQELARMSAFSCWKASCWAGPHTQTLSFLSKPLRVLSSIPGLGRTSLGGWSVLRNVSGLQFPRVLSRQWQLSPLMDLFWFLHCQLLA